MKNSIVRFGRSLVGLLVAGAASKYAGDTRYTVLVAPALAALGKKLREKNPEKYSWLPF